MRILLPPSEAKHAGGRGRSLAGRSASQPIDEARRLTLDALATLLETPGKAPAALLLPPSVADAAIEENLRVRSSPTLPAIRRYAGIVYDGLDVEHLSAAAQQLAGKQLLIFSGLFGVLRGADPVPAYRVPAKAVLPGLGIAGSFWRPRLATLLPPLLGRSGLIVDLRSTDYASMWQPARGSREASRLLTVRVLSRKPDGGLGVISYPSKLAKGKLAAALLERAASGEPIRGAEDVRAVWASLGGSDTRPGPASLGNALDLME
ncbi:MAG: peroxide stress protein YaaA [Actinomycetota bacterium]|nr:peroxide stress protein YaaA [Actinomycetota bacterium]MDQ2955684.1 peroxide stress protein YaaA [Actinomycetota bacterium]